jgi:hypothetical protein
MMSRRSSRDLLEDLVLVRRVKSLNETSGINICYHQLFLNPETAPATKGPVNGFPHSFLRKHCPLKNVKAAQPIISLQNPQQELGPVAPPLILKSHFPGERT